MKQIKFFLLFTLGLTTAGFGVGGVENSTNTVALMASCLVAALGLTMMYLSTHYVKDLK